MANQPPHEWNANIYHEVEKRSRETITLAQTFVKNARNKNSQNLSYEDPDATVGDLSNVVCTLLEIIEEQGVTPEMVARLMGKRVGGRDQAVHRLLPMVKKEIKSEQKDSKALTIARLDQKAADIAVRKRHPKAKGKGKGPKSARENAADTVGAFSEAVREDKAQEKAKNEQCAELVGG